MKTTQALSVLLVGIIGISSCSASVVSSPKLQEPDIDGSSVLWITTRNLYVNEGDTVELYCYGTKANFSKLVWSERGRKLRSYGGVSFSNQILDSYLESKLKIENVSKPWAGKFTCGGIMGDKTVKDHVYLHVQESPNHADDDADLPSWPHFGVTKKDVYAQKGDTVELHCGAYTDFVYKTSWYKNGHILRPYEKMSFRNTWHNYYLKSKLIISNVDKTLEGKYTCNGTTIPGDEVLDDVYLHVEE